jgi:hypothetical protein
MEILVANENFRRAMKFLLTKKKKCGKPAVEPKQGNERIYAGVTFVPTPKDPSGTHLHTPLDSDARPAHLLGYPLK